MIGLSAMSFESDPAVMALIVFITVFAALLVLFFCARGISYNKANHNEKNTTFAEPRQASAVLTDVPQELAPGRSGTLRLVNVSDRDAALLMAIVAEEMKVSLNKINFKSIVRCEGKDNEI